MHANRGAGVSSSGGAALGTFNLIFGNTCVSISPIDSRFASTCGKPRPTLLHRQQSPDDPRRRQPASPPHDRVHDGPQVRREGATRYIRHIESFAKFLGRSLNTASVVSRSMRPRRARSRRGSTPKLRRCASSARSRSAEPTSPTRLPAGITSQVQGGAEHRLWRGSQELRCRRCMLSVPQPRRQTMEDNLLTSIEELARRTPWN